MFWIQIGLGCQMLRSHDEDSCRICHLLGQTQKFILSDGNKSGKLSVTHINQETGHLLSLMVQFESKINLGEES